MISFYTVALQEPGYPVYFMCPGCPHVHSHPENLDEAHFQDPGEASQEFKIIWKPEIKWIHLPIEVFIALVNVND